MGVLRTPFGCLFSSIATQSHLAFSLVFAHAIRESRDPPPSTATKVGDIQQHIRIELCDVERSGEFLSQEKLVDYSHTWKGITLAQNENKC